MSMTTSTFSPGSLVRARGREWIVLTGSSSTTLRVRPLSGSEEDATAIHLGLEAAPVTEATFPAPSAKQKAGHDGAQLLRDALVLSMRRGAGPFRSFGQISVEPRAYQLVPLLMALKLDTVRLLVADDVGVGKTIEAALIAREFIDRGDIDRFAVLCPPHLVEQWVSELEHRFHLRAVAVTAASATRLERGLPQTESIFTQYPYTVVSLDYIKSERRRADFVRACPGFVIVDEAHTCAATGQGRHQRYELLRELSADRERHLVLLTATPHSGDDAAFYRLLGLLDRDFEGLYEAEGDRRKQLRERLANHFVQRRRPDIHEWKDESVFPDRLTSELTYLLTGEWERFFDAVLDYCAGIVVAAAGDERRQRLNFFSTLALMRCVASSPRAALRALRTRAGMEEGEGGDEELETRLFDGAADSLTEDDVEPPAGVEDAQLDALMKQAAKLSGQAGDPKLKVLASHLETLFLEGCSPVVFCRYIATAEYLGDHLKKRFPQVSVSVVTGDFTSDERKLVVETLSEAEQRLLIATDCLSEGINLQESFDAVVHYDLSWNPTRHEQREGRVDRFGQTQKKVRATLLYGSNNPVDGAVLDVIIRKAERIRKELGVPVPLPDDNHALTQALMKAVLLRHRGEAKQQVLDLGVMTEAKTIDVTWESAKERAKANRTVFAQRSLAPDDVLPEFRRTRAAIGSRDDVQRFTDRALTRLGAGPEYLKRGARVPLGSLPDDVRERLDAEGLSGTIRVDFNYPPAAGCRPVQRSHPLVSVLADTLLERTLSSSGEEERPAPGVLGRVGCWVSGAVKERTVVTLLRLRHQLVSTKAKRSTTLLVEECSSVAWAGADSITKENLDALQLLGPAPDGDPPPHVRERVITQALSELAARRDELAAFAERRATLLLDDHRRVREAAAARGSYSVKALLPVDVIALFVLLPKVD